MLKTSHAHPETEYQEPVEGSSSTISDGYGREGYEDDLVEKGTGPADVDTQMWEVGIEPPVPAPGGKKRDGIDEEAQPDKDRELADPLHWYIQTVKRNHGPQDLLGAEEERALAREVEPMRHYRRLERDIINRTGRVEADPVLVTGELVRRVASASPVLWAAGLSLNLPVETTLTEALEDPSLRVALDDRPQDEMVAFIADVLNVDEKGVRDRLEDLSRDLFILPEEVLADLGRCGLRSLSEAPAPVLDGLTRDRDPALYARRFQQVVSRGEEARNRLVGSNLRLACKWAVESGRQREQKGLVMEIVSAANLGLLQAAESFDHRRETRFSTYATACIRNEIGRFLSDQGSDVKLPRHVRSAMREQMRARQRLEQELGREPSWEEIAEEMGTSVARVERLLQASRTAQPAEYLSESRDNGKTVLTALSKILADPSPRIEDQVCDDIMRENPPRDLAEAMNQLPERQRKVLEFRYFPAFGEPPTLEEVGRNLGISRQAVSKLEKKAKDNLRRRLTGCEQFAGPIRSSERFLNRHVPERAESDPGQPGGLQPHHPDL